MKKSHRDEAGQVTIELIIMASLLLCFYQGVQKLYDHWKIENSKINTLKVEGQLVRKINDRP